MQENRSILVCLFDYCYLSRIRYFLARISSFSNGIILNKKTIKVKYRIWSQKQRDSELGRAINQPVSRIDNLFVKCIRLFVVPSRTSFWSMQGCFMNIARENWWFSRVCCANINCYSITICHCFCINLVQLRKPWFMSTTTCSS